MVDFLSQNIKIQNKYKVCEKIGSGSFGDLYLALNIQTNELSAIKIEKGE